MGKQHKKPEFQISDESSDAVHISTFEITYEAILEPSFKRLPKRIKDRTEPLFYEIRKNPKETIPELLNLIKKYPRVPTFYNYLSVAYNRMGDKKKEEEAVLLNMKKNPNYLFAKINYAQILLNRKEYDKIPEIFNYKFDLKQLYPKRKVFHISEFSNFMGLIGVYFYEIGERNSAEVYHKILQEIAPKEPASKMLKRKLHPGIFLRLINHFVSNLENKWKQMEENIEKLDEEFRNEKL